MSLAVVNQFEPRVDRPKKCQFSRGRDKKVRFVVQSHDGRTIWVYDMKAKSPVQTITLNEAASRVSLQDSILLVSTVSWSRAYNCQTMQVVFQSIPGTLCQLSSQELLLLTGTTLYHIDMLKVDGIKEIQHFELGVHDFLFSDPREAERLLVVSSSLTYLYNMQTNSLSQLNFVFSKLLFCNSEYLCGLTFSTGGLCVRSLLAGFTVFETTNPCRNVLVFDEQICFIEGTCLMIYNLSRTQAPLAQLSLGEEQVTDLLVTEQSIYAITADLKLLGTKRSELYNKTIKKTQSTTEVQPKPENDPRSQSILIEDLSKTLVGIDSEQYLINGLLCNIKQEHTRFQTSLTHRMNCLRVIHKWWSTGNVRACMNALEHHEDNAILCDSLKFMRGGLPLLPRQHLPTLFRICDKLLNSKYPSHVQAALQSANCLLEQLHSLPKGDPQVQRGITASIQTLRKSPRLAKILSAKLSADRRSLFEAATLLNRSLDRHAKISCG